jgi:geranylgeranyl diphosphate synthase type II
MQKRSSNSEAMTILSNYKRLVWPEIEKYLHSPTFPDIFKVPKKYKGEEQFYWKISKEYPRRQGKYLRPTLLLLTCEAMEGKLQEALKTAAAMQISEEWLLIHDDIEDDSEMRRGKPTLHRKYGAEQAINAGDTLHVIMWKILTDNREFLGKEKTAKLVNEFYTMLMRTTLGQAVEIKWTKEKNTTLSDEDWFFIADGKTSYYTIAGPMRLGAIIAGANKPQLDLLAQFGSYLGRCFQLVDDLLDLTSDFRGLKKQIGNDIYEGKRTLILGHLLRNINPKDKKRLLSILRKSRKEKSGDEVKWIISKMRKYKSIDYGRKFASNLKGKALEIFEKDLKFLSVQPARNYLKEIINFILERNH